MILLNFPSCIRNRVQISEKLGVFSPENYFALSQQFEMETQKDADEIKKTPGSLDTRFLESSEFPYSELLRGQRFLTRRSCQEKARSNKQQKFTINNHGYGDRAKLQRRENLIKDCYFAGNRLHPLSLVTEGFVSLPIKLHFGFANASQALGAISNCPQSFMVTISFC